MINLIILVLLISSFFFIIIIFSFPHFSPIPYFPSQKKDLRLITKALNLKNHQAVIDFGAGSGEVIFEAAQYAFDNKIKTVFFAIEINPILIFILWFKRLFHPNKKNIKIIYDDIFKINLKNLKKFKSVVFYFYLSPWFLDQLVKKIKTQIKTFDLVSYMYSLKKSRPKKILKGLNSLYLYSF